MADTPKKLTSINRGPGAIGPTGPAREGSSPGEGDRRATPKNRFLSLTGPSR
jgi:hypothetical protein